MHIINDYMYTHNNSKKYDAKHFSITHFMYIKT